MPRWHSDHIVANGIRMYYTRTGGDKPPVVLAHGITDNGLCWSPVARALERDYDVTMYDARGHGLTEASANGYTWQALVNDLAALLRALGLERPVLIGHSMGAQTSAGVAARSPHLVRALVLEDPPWREHHLSDTERQARLLSFQASILENRVSDREALIGHIKESAPTWSDEEAALWAEAKQQVSADAARIVASPLPPWREVAATITCPTLLVTADPARGAIVTPEMAQEAESLMRRAQVVRIEGAGHSIHREQFDAMLRAVTEFMSAL